MDEEKNVPEIRFEEFENEWKPTALNDISKNIGTGKSKYELVNSNYRGLYPILGSRSIIGYDEDYDYEGDFLLTARVGENAGSLYTYKGKAKITDNTVYIEADSLDFLENLLDYKNIKNMSFGSGQPLIKASELKKLDLFTPNRLEKDSIGNFFKEINRNIKLKEIETSKVKQYKQAMLQKMFPKEGETVPEIRFEGFEEKWNQRNLGSSGYTFTGLSGKSKKDFGHGEARYVPYTNVFNNPITNLEVLEKIEIDRTQNEVQCGDVFFTTSSETPEEVGMASVWKHNTKNVYLNSFCFGYRPTEEFDLDFLAYLLHSPLIRGQFQILAQGISRFNISKTKAMNIEFLVPTTEEQKEIGKYFVNLQKNIDSKQAELDKLKQFKQAMLDKMFV